jgi:hypothetical protein
LITHDAQTRRTRSRGSSTTASAPGFFHQALGGRPSVVVRCHFTQQCRELLHACLPDRLRTGIAFEQRQCARTTRIGKHVAELRKDRYHQGMDLVFVAGYLITQVTVQADQFPIRRHQVGFECSLGELPHSRARAQWSWHRADPFWPAILVAGDTGGFALDAANRAHSHAAPIHGRVAGGASRFPGPLRTVRAPLSAHGSSPSRTARLLLLFVLCSSGGFAFYRQRVTVVTLLAVAQCPFRRSMNVLVAEEMNQNKVTVDILAPLGACMEVVHLEFFLIEERFSALWTPTMLSLRKLLFPTTCATRLLKS